MRAAAYFLVALSVSGYAQTNHFVYTNNNPDGPNSVSGWSVGAGGALTPVAGSPFATGGDGAGTGFFATVGVQTLLVGDYLYATNDGDSVNGHTTVAGFVLAQLGHLPATGENFRWRGLRFEVVDMDGRRIDKLLIQRLAAG